LMFTSVFVLFVVPWLDTSPVKSGRYRPIFKYLFWLLVISCFALGWSGGQLPEGLPLWVGRIAGAFYFLFFFAALPLLGWYEKPLPLPESISADYSKKSKG
jgi:ubiquinol-cytochrome c reductase cytochrome b/c1 subunit